MRAGDVLAAMKELPFADAGQIVGNATTMVVAPHPDDEVLGCGGLIAILADRGLTPVVVFITDGGMSHPSSQKYPRAELVALREIEAKQATSILGIPQDRLRFLRLPDSRAPQAGPEFDAVVADIVSLATEFKCKSILAPWSFDPHCDNLAAHKMAAAAAQAVQICHFSYPVWGWTLLQDLDLGQLHLDGWRVDISSQLCVKFRALQAHASQLTGLIDDDATGFRLDEVTLRRMTHNFEVFLVNV